MAVATRAENTPNTSGVTDASCESFGTSTGTPVLKTKPERDTFCTLRLGNRTPGGRPKTCHSREKDREMPKTPREGPRGKLRRLTELARDSRLEN